MTSNAENQSHPTLWEAPDGRDEGSATTAPRRAAAPTTSRPTKPREFSELWSIDELWSNAEVATYLGVPKQTIYCWRTTGYGPHGFRVGKHLRWRATTVLAWTIDLERDQ